MADFLETIHDAKKVIAQIIVETPMIPATGLATGADVYMKAENLQRTGSFKIRGAFYRISKLSEEEKKQGVIAYSAGNHAQGVALAAQQAGIKCVICMPENAPIYKIQRTESFGAEVVLVPGEFQNTAVRAKELQEKHGYVFIHPFNDYDIIAGQGTIGLEICEQIPDADIVIAAVGGGGLVSGVARAVKSINPQCKVYGVEAENQASMKKSLDYNEITTLRDFENTVADGIAVAEPGTITFDIARQMVDGVVTVTETQITLAMLKMMEDYKLLVEGAGAASIAAVMFGKIDIKGKKVVCVVSGGNVDINLVEKVINKGLKQTGRLTTFRIVLDDKPRALYELLLVMGEMGANIVSMNHDRFDVRVNSDQTGIDVTFESRGREHQQHIIAAVEDAGYEVSLDLIQQ